MNNQDPGSAFQQPQLFSLPGQYSDLFFGGPSVLDDHLDFDYGFFLEPPLASPSHNRGFLAPEEIPQPMPVNQG